MTRLTGNEPNGCFEREDDGVAIARLDGLQIAIARPCSGRANAGSSRLRNV